VVPVKNVKNQHILLLTYNLHVILVLVLVVVFLVLDVRLVIDFCYGGILPVQSCEWWGTGIRGLTRRMETPPQGNQEPFMVRDKVGRPQESLG